MEVRRRIMHDSPELSPSPSACFPFLSGLWAESMLPVSSLVVPALSLSPTFCSSSSLMPKKESSFQNMYQSMASRRRAASHQHSSSHSYHAFGMRREDAF